MLLALPLCSIGWWRMRWFVPQLWMWIAALLPLAIESFLPLPSSVSPSSLWRTRQRLEPSSTHLCLAWQSHVSTHPDAFHAFNKIYNNDVVGDKGQFDLAILFVGQAHAADFEALVRHAHRQISSAPHGIQWVSLLGGGVIGENVELDEPQRPSMSLLIGSLPDGAELTIVEHSTNNIQNPDTQQNVNMLEQLEDRFASCLIFADPFAPVERLLTGGQRVIAGGITCPSSADQSSLAVGGRCLPPGSAVGIAFAGTLGLQTMVAQGCRPVAGAIFRVTACDGNVITKLDGKPALQVLQDVASQAPPNEQKQMSLGLLCGITASSSSDTDGGTDFLSRQIMGFVPSVQGIAIGTTQVEPGDLFCFQVRDGTTAQQDLKLMVQRAKNARLFDTDATQPRPVAAIQISCVARGRGMFDGVPNVDLSNVKELVGMGETPVVAGFFANGEIGPVGLAGFSTTSKDKGGQQAYLHSFTTVAATFCEYTTLSTSPSLDNGNGEGGRQPSFDDAWG